MSTLLERIKADIMTYRRSKESAKVTLLQTLVGELETLQKKGEKFDDARVMKTINSFINNNNIVITAFPDDPRSILLKNENDLLSSYLPSILSEQEIDNIISENTFTSLKEGMEFFKANYTGQYDGSVVSKKLKEVI